MRLMTSLFVLAAWCSLAPATLSAQQPNDAQIAAIVVTANQVDIDAGKLAESKATSPEVKAFGTTDGDRPHRSQQAGYRARDEAWCEAGRQSDGAEPEERRRR